MQLKNDILYEIYDKHTGTDVMFKKASALPNGATITDGECDGVSVRKYNGDYYIRTMDTPVNAAWYGASPAASAAANTAAIQAALNTAAKLKRDVVILESGSYLTDSMLVMPAGVSLTLSQKTTVKATVAGQIIFKLTIDSRIEGGLIDLGTVPATGVFVWGGDPNGGTGQHHTYFKSNILGGLTVADQVGIIFATGCDSAMTAAPPGTFGTQRLAYITVEAKINRVHKGILVKNFGGGMGADWVNGLMIRGYIDADPAIDLSFANGCIVDVEVQSGNDIDYTQPALMMNGQVNNVRMALWDWPSNHPLSSPMTYASAIKAIVFGASARFNKVELLQSLPALFIDDRGNANDVLQPVSDTVKPTSSFAMLPNSPDGLRWTPWDDVLFAADKRYVVTSTSSASSTNLPRLFNHDPSNRYAMTDAATTKEILITSPVAGTEMCNTPRVITVSFARANLVAEYVKIEVKNTSGVWTTVWEVSGNSSIDVSAQLYSYGNLAVAVESIRVSVQRASGNVEFSGISCYCVNTSGKNYLSVAGGKMYGAVDFNNIAALNLPNYMPMQDVSYGGDVDLLTSIGVRRVGAGAANLPVAFSGCISVLPFGSSGRVQIYIQSGTSCKWWQRTLNFVNGTVGAWIPMSGGSGGNFSAAATGAATVLVAHGLGATPPVIILTAKNSDTAAAQPFVSAIGSVNITVGFVTPMSTGTVSLGWVAVY